MDRPRLWFRVVLLALLAGCAGAPPMIATPWGEADSQSVALYTLDNGRGLRATFTNYGATLVSLWLPDRHGQVADVVLGFDQLAGYSEQRHPYFGCIAGRYANRIARGHFTLDGKDYTLATNNAPNHLHGGVRGFDRKVWRAAPADSAEGPGIVFTLVSPDGDEGYPGKLLVAVLYRLTFANELRVEMQATPDAPTLCNLAQHSYWNLAGHGSGDILGHELRLHAARYTPTDTTLIPTGELAVVAGTPFDFRAGKAIGTDLAAFKQDPALQQATGGGYDVNFAVDGPVDQLRPVATLRDPASGRSLELLADQPGVQLYTGNFLDGSVRGKGGVVYRQHAGLCLETQKYPDSIHHDAWPSPILRPGQTYRHTMVYRFRWND